jgi:hypothetical protein
MLVEKPFGIGFSLNLANWRSWVTIAVIAGLVWQEGSEDEPAESTDPADEEPVEVVVD